MKHEFSTYTLIAITVATLLIPQYHGWGAILDDIATWRNNGYPASEAREAVKLTNSVSARKIK